MREFAIGFTRAPGPAEAAAELAAAVEAQLGAGSGVAGGLLLATAAAGLQGPEAGRLLARRWPDAGLAGTSFEGIVAQGELSRDRPALALLAWPQGSQEPGLFACGAEESDVDRIAHEILEAAGPAGLGPRDLVLLFPDAFGAAPIEAIMVELEGLLGSLSIAGAGASGLEGEPALGWLGEEDWPGGLLGLVVPGGATEAALRPRLCTAGATRGASPWLCVTRSRGHWIDRLEDESALDCIRRELGLADRKRLEAQLGRLLVRVRRRPEPGPPGVESGDEPDFDERFVVGLDPRRGSISLPIGVSQGNEIALALPDAGVARNALEASIEAMPRTDVLIHFGCRARDASLHGDEDLEAALVAHHARDRGTSALGEG
jgi:small ligand-binding sensory domain FIST